jgi:branched-chain amino acid transport system permease protein
LQIILRRLETGSIYALAALGIIIIYRTSNTTNFAKGAVAMFNTFVGTYLFNRFGLPLCTAVMGGILSAIVT